MERRGHIVSSVPYGQACLQCFRAKCRCIARGDSSSCERCYRLKKTCESSDSVRKRRATGTNAQSESRIAVLETRLNGIVSALQSATGSSDPSVALSRLLEERISPSSATQNAPASNTSPANPTAVATPATSVESLELSAAEEETCLEVFKTRLLPSFPFIHIPPTATAQQLRQDKPFLFRAIVAVTSVSTQQKLTRGMEFKKLISQTALVENQSNVDLLLGILTFVAWSYDQYLRRRGTLSRLIIMAMSIVYDLRMHRPVPSNAHMLGPMVPGFEGCIGDRSLWTGERYLERHRAVLACFMLSSVISTYFAQIDAMRWTSQMEEGLEALSNGQDNPNDRFLAAQVRFQLLAQKTNDIRDQYDRPLGDPPSLLYLKGLQAQVQEVWDSLSPGLQSQDLLKMHMHYVKLSITETAHTSNSDAPIMSDVSLAGGGISGLSRLECLWQSTLAIKSWFGIFLKLPPFNLSGFSLITASQKVRSIVVLYRLSILKDPAWDRKAVQSEVDIMEVLEQIANQTTLASIEAGEQDSDDLHQQLSRMMRVLRTFVVAKMNPEEQESSPPWNQDVAGVEGNSDSINQDTIMMAEPMVPDNDRWMEEFFSRF